MLKSGVVKRSWWVAAFLALSYFGYAQAIKPKETEIGQLKFRLGELQKERRVALNEKEDLIARIHSQNDPAWIEMILMKELGVVPDGYLKVHFKKRT